MSKTKKNTSSRGGENSGPINNMTDKQNTIAPISPTSEITNQDKPFVSKNTSNEFYALFSWVWNSKNAAIIILVVLLVLSFLGVNILLIIGSFFQWLIGIIGPFISTVLSYIGYATGSVINKTADVVSDTAKTGIDIADGTVHSVGNLLRNGSNADVDVATRIKLDNVSYDLMPTSTSLPTGPPPAIPTWSFQSFFSQIDSQYSQEVNLDNILNSNGQTRPDAPSPNNTDHPIQTSGSKESWCLTGEYKGKRGCVEIGLADKCMSGQIYPTEAKCLNIDRSTNMPSFEHEIKEVVIQEKNVSVSSDSKVQESFDTSSPLSPLIVPRLNVQDQPPYNRNLNTQTSVLGQPVQQIPNTQNVMVNGYVAKGPIPPPPAGSLHGLTGIKTTRDGPAIVSGPVNYFE